MIDYESPLFKERAAIAASLGIEKCSHCRVFCPYCPRLLAVRPDLIDVPSPRRPQETTSPQQAPSVWRQARNVAGAIVEHVAAGLPQADEDTVRNRILTCERCEHFQLSQRRCLICGCFADIKVRWREQRCPDVPPRW